MAADPYEIGGVERHPGRAGVLVQPVRFRRARNRHDRRTPRGQPGKRDLRARGTLPVGDRARRRDWPRVRAAVRLRETRHCRNRRRRNAWWRRLRRSGSPCRAVKTARSRYRVRRARAARPARARAATASIRSAVAEAQAHAAEAERRNLEPAAAAARCACLRGFILLFPYRPARRGTPGRPPSRRPDAVALRDGRQSRMLS